MELAVVLERYSPDLLDDELADGHQAMQRYRVLAEIDDLQSDGPFEAGVNGRRSEVDQHATSCIGAFALDTRGQARASRSTQGKRDSLMGSPKNKTPRLKYERLVRGQSQWLPGCRAELCEATLVEVDDDRLPVWPVDRQLLSEA